jgi:CHAT domain-containing protein
VNEIDGWAEYRARVEREHPNYARAVSRREIEELLAKLKAIDKQVADLVRPLSPQRYATLSGVLDLIRRQQATAVGIESERDYPRWYSEFIAALGAGTVDFDAWAQAERLGSIAFIADRMTGLRQVAPQPQEPLPAPGPGEVRDPAITAAAEPHFQRFRAIIGRVAPGKAGPDVDAELEALLADERALAARTRPGSPDRADCDFRIGSVLNQLGRSAAFQGNRTAPGWFAQAADVWRSLGHQDQVADSLQRFALAVLASDGDVDQALELMLGELDRQPGEPAVFQARLLAQIASILASAGDSFDAATRIGEAAAVLDALGFADPTAAGAERAFAGWMAAGRLGERTQATLSAVTSLWASIIGTRVQLPPADRARSGTDATDVVLTTTLSQLSALARRLGQEASAAAARVDNDVEALLQPAAPDPASGPAAHAPGALDEERIAQDLSRLRERYDVTEDVPGLNAILAEAATLEQEATAARLPALAVAAALLRGDGLSWLKRNQECARVLTAACENLEKATGIADSERRALLVQLFMRTTMAYAMHGDFVASSAAAEKGIVIAELDRGKASSPYLQDSYLRERRRLYDAGVFAAFKLDDRDLLLRRAELAKARGSLGWLAAEAGVTAEPDPVAPSPLAPDLESEFRALSARSDGDPAAAARRRILWTRLMAQQARRHEVAALEPFSVAAVQARLGPRDAVIYHYWLSQAVLLIITIDHLNTAVERIDLTSRRDDLAEMATSLAALDTEVGWLEDEIPPLGRLLLPSRQGAALLAGKRRLLISPQGFLHQLPFHAFDWDGEPLISRFAVSYIPNLTTLLAERAAPARNAGVFGLAISRFAAARPLISAPAELAGVAAAYDGTPVRVTTLGEGAATRARLDGLGASGRLRDLGVLHFATHGQSGSADDPFSARLLLADGHVDGLDISQWDLGAELVVLSACQVGQRAISGRTEAARPADGHGGEALFGDEMFGLPAAFFSAGAREVLGGLWPVNDKAALAIMPALHKHLASGLPSDVALALAVNAYREQAPGIYKWASLKLVSIARPAPATKP